MLIRKTFFLFAASLLAFVISACGGSSSNNGGGGDTCTPGTSGCPCAAEDSCNDGLMCFNNICVPDPDSDEPDADNNDPDADPDANNDDPDVDPDSPTGLGLTVLADDARACEVVLDDPQEKIASVVFTDGAQGKVMRRGNRLAVAFHAQGDEAIPAGAADFEMAAGATDLEGISVMVQRCFDAQGGVIDGDQLEISDRR